MEFVHSSALRFDGLERNLMRNVQGLRCAVTTMHRHEQDIATLKETLEKLQSVLNHVVEKNLSRNGSGMIEADCEVRPVHRRLLATARCGEGDG